MTTAILYHDDCLGHINPVGHPERVERLAAVTLALRSAEFSSLKWVDAPPATDQQVSRVHPQSYLDFVQSSVPKTGFTALDADTMLSPLSLSAIRRAAGAVCKAVDIVVTKSAQNALCAVRPPGHQAEAATAMGFCTYNNVAIAARHALDFWGLKRVAIVDFDVHHGNGTQNIVWNNPNIAYVSTHQSPLYPGTGLPEETGASGNILNLPLPPHSGPKVFRERLFNEGFPFLHNFGPQLLLISAGFDAHRADPLANLNLNADDFAWVTEVLCDLADEHCDGRVVSTLEGGYDLDALAESVATHVRVLMERAA